MEKKFSVGIYTLGCKVNQYESEAIAEQLSELGLTVTSPHNVCDAYVINTCTVTAESDRKARQFIRRAIQKNPEARIVVTGCLAQTSAQNVAEIRGVDCIIGNTNKLSCADSVLSLLSSKKSTRPLIQVNDINESIFEPMCIKRFDRTRAYLKIEDGCENHCSYCIIPYARGKVRSKPCEDVIRELELLASAGCREVVLTGIETASYGKDVGNTNLATLLELADKVEGIERIRLGSLDPSLITDEFVSRISSLKHLAPHFHLSLQSGSSNVLAKMKRKYNADMAMAVIKRLKKSIPNAQFTTDIIVGFPGETDEDFERTCAFVREAGFLTVHIFQYSKRDNTPAASMPDQIPSNIKKMRSELLAEISCRLRAEVLADFVMNTAKCQVLFETYADGYAKGHTASFIEVAVVSDRPLHSELRWVEIKSSDGELCFGELLD